MEEVTISWEEIYKIVTLSFSCISLVVSILVAWSNRKTLHVEIDKIGRAINDGEVFVFREFDDGVWPFSYGKGLLLKMEVVNPSPKDIAFFDLRCFYPETNMDTVLLTRRAMIDKDRDKTVWKTIKTPEGYESMTELIIPEQNYGVFKSGSFTKFDILVFPNENANRLCLTFKVAKKAIRKDPYAVTDRKKFKFFGQQFDIHSWTKNLSYETSCDENTKAEATLVYDETPQ